MTEPEELAAIQRIHALKARYFRTMDMKDWAGLEAVFVPDVVADFRESTGQFDDSQLTHGAVNYVTKLAAILEHVQTVHHGHMPEITMEGPDRASGVWAMEDKLWVQEGSSLPFSWMHGYGHYHERYVRIGEEWHIQEIRLSRIHVDIG